MPSVFRHNEEVAISFLEQFSFAKFFHTLRWIRGGEEKAKGKENAMEKRERMEVAGEEKQV